MKGRKYKELEKERDKYKELAEQRGELIDHLKRDKKGLRSLLNQVINSIPSVILQFLKENKHFQKQPYVFISSSGRIVGHTSGFKKQLDLDGELTGMNCYTCLKNKHSELGGVPSLRRFFNTYEEREFDTPIQEGNKEVRLNFVKGEPVTLKDLDLRVLGRKRTIDAIAFIPVLVKHAGRFHRDRDLNKQVRGYEQERRRVYRDLIIEYGWTEKQITDMETEVGYKMLRKTYLELRKTPREEMEKKK